MSRQYAFNIIEHTMIPLPDGTRLAARIWMPQTDQESEFPAVLEYLPYRKRDGTSARDESTFPVFASAGIVGVRVDICGHGESDGEFDDEYSERELKQGTQIIEWISTQRWSNGNIGMMGISWGGFNAMQIASMHPPALKAVISIGSTVDRYNDDIHYKNGCHLYSNFYWSNMMLTYAARAPDPMLRSDWQAIWKHRLEQQPFPLQLWLAHQRRDSYWEHGSVCEDYAGYTVPTLVIGGWADLYHNAPPELAANTAGVVKAINGPWIHKYPHFAWPKPRMDFHTEAIAWWNRWLRGEQTYPDDTPDYRVYMSENVRAGGERLVEPGRWLAIDHWPEETNAERVFLSGDLTLDKIYRDCRVKTLTINSPQDCGTSCGEIFSLAPDADLAGDQRIDDGGSLVFKSPTLTEPVEIIGRPKIQLTVSIDKPLGNLCVRLVDVHPDGHAHRVSWGVLNLAHRISNASPCYMTPGKTETVRIDLDHCAYRFAVGHRLQVSISTNYWPAIHPPPEVVTAIIHLDEQAWIALPSVRNTRDINLPAPENDELLPQYPLLTQPVSTRKVERDLQAQCTTYSVYSDTGELEIPQDSLRVQHIRDEKWQIGFNDPQTMRAEGKHSWKSERNDWRTDIECVTHMHCDAEYFYITAQVKAWLNGELFNTKAWDEKIRRDYL